MSSFSNLLSSLGGTQQPAPAISQENAAFRPRPAAPPAASSRPFLPATAGVKRKHDDGLASPPPKVSNQLSRTVPHAKSALKPADHEQPHQLPKVKIPGQTTQASARPSTPLSAQGKDPPKNSYQAMLARAQTSQTKQPGFGQIKHKPVQRPARQIRSQTPEQGVKVKDPKIIGRSPVSSNAKKARPGAVFAGGPVIKPKRKPLELDYKGTMRPSNTPLPRETASKSPANVVSRAKPSTPSTIARLPERNAQRPLPTDQRYRYKPESDAEEEEDYASDSDAMEGGGFDELLEEEETSARAARKEDAEELRYETEHKRQKAEKKKAMERLLAARKGKSEG